MAPFQPSPESPRGDHGVHDPRFVDLFGSEADADVLMCGIPYDGAVLGRKGAREGPGGIRSAMRWLGTDGLAAGPLRRRMHDLGDVVIPDGTVLAVHDAVADALREPFGRGKPLVVLGGDNSLSYPVLSALAAAQGARAGGIGIVVVDAHYDLRPYDGQPTSGTPFRRILTEMPTRPVAGKNLVEVGLRPYANSAGLAAYAREQGVHIVARDQVRAMGPAAAAEEAIEHAGDGVDHMWLSIDIDAFDQSIASGCSAPGMDGLLLHDVAPLLETMARDTRCRGLEVMETAPPLDPTGNTCRSAAWLVSQYIASLR